MFAPCCGALQTFYLSCVRDWYCSNTSAVNPDHLHCASGQTLDDASTPAAIQACADAASCACEQPLSFVSSRALPLYWQVAYWTSQLLTWCEDG